MTHTISKRIDRRAVFRAAVLAAALGYGASAQAGIINPGDPLPPTGPPMPGGADPAFVFTFASNNGSVSATANLNATFNADQVNFPGYTAVSGTLTVTGGVDAGSYSLVANPNAPNSNLNYDSSFSYDNQLLAGQNPVVNQSGLLFSTTGTDSGIEINIWSTTFPGPSSPVPNGTYSLSDINGNSILGDATLNPASVPEPSSLLLFGFATLVIGGRYVRRRRKSSIPA